MNKLDFQKFSLNELIENPSILIIGKRGSKKSLLIRDILNTMPNVSKTIILPYDYIDTIYSDMPNVKKIEKKYQSKIIEDVIINQKFLLKVKNENLVDNLNVNESMSESESEQMKQLLNNLNSDENYNKYESISEEMKQSLNSLNFLVHKSLSNGMLNLNDIAAMKNITETLNIQKLNQEIKKELKQVNDFVGSLLIKDNIEINDLYTTKQMIDEVTQLKVNKLNKDNEEVINKIHVSFYDENDELFDQNDNNVYANDYKDVKFNQNSNELKHAIVFDDCINFKEAWSNDHIFEESLINGRHWHITNIVSKQFPLGISPHLKSNFDYIFLFGDDNNNTNVKRLFKHFGCLFPNFNTFRQVFKQMTLRNGCMVIKNNGSHINIFNKVAYL